MDTSSKKSNTSNKTMNNKQKKTIILGILICLVVLLISAIGLQLMASDPTPSDSDSDIETKTEMTNNNNETSELLDNNSTDNTTAGNNQNEENNTQEVNQSDTDQNTSFQNENSNDDTSSYTPPSNGGNGGSESGEDDSTTEDDSSDENGSESEPSDCIVNLPTYPVKAKATLDMNISYFITNITGIFGDYDIINNSYLTWCIDYGHYMNYTQKNVTLYSSYCPPEVYQLTPENWSAVNYILNNKPEKVSYHDIQTAIWHYVNFGSTPTEPTANAWNIINDVQTNNGTSFIPGPGDIIAIIIESELEPASDQLSILENPIPLVPGIANLTLNKSANISIGSIGSSITYIYNITNAGDVTIYSLNLTDDKLGKIPLNNTTLAPGNSIIQTANYTITETDLPGPILNNAIITGTTIFNESVCAEDNESVSITYTPSISVEKQANVTSATVGDKINYIYNMTNTGDVTIYSLNLTDDKLGKIPLNNTTLAPGNSIIQTANYTITETDLPGPLVNIVDISGFDPLNQSVNDTDSFSLDLNYVASINISKNADCDTATLGSTVNYSYQITNTGKVSLKNIKVVDNKLGVILLNTTTLSPNEWANGTASYIISCEDIQHSTLQNIAIVNAKTHLNESVTDQITEEILLSYQPDISISKTVRNDEAHSWQKEITVIEEHLVLFNITLQNTGEETLHDVIIIDALPDQLTYANNASITPVNFSSDFVKWVIPQLQVDESIHITYNTYASMIGNGTNNASATVDLCNDTLMVQDNVSITVLPCPPKVWVKRSWLTQTQVNYYNSSLTFNYDAYNNIQDAVNNVCTCGIVYVLNGTYKEQIVINKDVSVYGASSAKVTFPSTLKSYSIYGSGSWSPLVLAYGGSLINHNITGNGTIGVLIDGFTIEGDFENDSVGVLYHNVESNCTPSMISNCTFTNLNIGIKIDGCSRDSTIIHNHIEWPDHTIEKTGVIITESNNCEPDNVLIHYNFIGESCGRNIGVWNQVNNVVNASLNWWGSPDGPSSPLDESTYDFNSNRVADGVGCKAIGKIIFDPWAGLDASLSVSQTNATTHNVISFNSQESFACKMNGSYYPLYSIKWDFGDGDYSFDSIAYHKYDSPGNYQVKLQVKAIDMTIWPSIMIDSDEVIIKVT